MSKKSKAVEVEVVAPNAEEEAAAKHGEMIAIEAGKGFALSRTYADNAVHGLSKALGNKFEVSSTGLNIKPDSQLTEAEATRAISTLAEVSEQNQVLGTTTMLALGDLIHIMRSQLGDDVADNLIHQAVSLTGRSKHTVQDAERVVEFCNEVFKDNPRPENLTPTHYQELKNNSRDRQGKPTIPAGKLRSIIKKVSEGSVVASFTLADGTEVEQRKPLSCAETRRLLNEAKGITDEEEKGEKESKEPASKGLKGFLYIPYAEPTAIKHSDELDKAALKEIDTTDGSPAYMVIDLCKKAVLKPTGKVLNDIVELADESAADDDATAEE